ncbi:MAG: serine O-acetyltransferase EpsC [Clostridia bacterium]|nr:serine O-acetyltransferase EpsC [Clostridia bacterium]
MTEANDRFEARVQALADRILDDYGNERVIDRLEMFTQPDRQIIEALIGKLLRLVFPGYFRDYTYRIYNPKNNLSALIEDVAFHLNRQIGIALKGGDPREDESIQRRAEDITAAFLERLPEIRTLVETDLQAAYDGDPAASSKAEVIIAYPGIYAITINRLAHVLYQLEVPLIPRIMTEYAHSKTGIDIHPGAQIGRYFFIDHGTGIVVGETTVIGDNVKVYQGVTLGALSTRGGQKLHGKRRHPTIEDNVTIYAGASILGGETIIGHDSVIGSNVFITHPIAPGTRVSIKNQELLYKNGQGYVLQSDIPEADPAWFYVI